MAKETPNRSSEGVRAQVFPRPDFPQGGWLSGTARAAVLPWHPTGTQERSSFRPPDARIAQRKRLHYAEFSQQPHTSFIPSTTPTIILFPPDGVEEASGFRSPKRRATQFYGAAQEDVFQVTPAFDPATGLWTIPSTDRAIQDKSLFHDLGKRPCGGGSTGPGIIPFDPSTTVWTQDSQFPRKPIARRFDAYPDDDVSNDVFQPPTASAWGIDSGLASKKKRLPTDNVDLEWISSIFASPFDPALVPWTVPSTDRKIQDKSLYHDLEKRPTGGGSSGPFIPPYDPAPSDWTIDSELPPAKEKPRVWLDALRSNQSFGLVDARDVDPGVEPLQDSFRTWARKSRVPSSDPLAGWGFVTLPPAFDPSANVWGISSDRVNTRKSRLFDQWPDDDTSVDFLFQAPAFDPSLFPFSVDARLREQHKRVPQLDSLQDAWLFTNLPAAFDPALSPESWDLRSPDRRKRTPQLDQQQDGWLQSGQFDAQFQPQWIDVRSKSQHKLVPQLDQPEDGWITVNVPPPFDFTLTSYSTDMRGRERLWKLSKFQGAYYYDYANSAWVHDVIPLVDPVIQNLTWRPIWGRRRR